MLSPSGLSKALWAEACNTAAYILNRTGKSSVDGKTPFELWYGQEVGNLDNLRIFGTGCYVFLQKKFRFKFDDKAVFGHLIGYVNEKDGYRVWIPSQNKVVCSHDVRFKPEVLCNLRSDVIISENVNESDRYDEYNTVSTSGGSVSELTHQDKEEDNQVHKSIRERKKPNWMTSGEFVCLSNVAQASQSLNPNSYMEAMQTDEREQWMQAMREELASLKENETWDLVKRPAGVQVIQNRWVLRVKESMNGTTRFKARLVAKGYVQKQGIDYDETFSPVARYDTIRTLLALAATKQMKLKQFDIKTAFLYGTLEEEVYLEQPDGFEDDSGRVCHLKRSLYGLKQAPRCWNKRFMQFMEKAGLKNSTADPCLFYRKCEQNSLYVAIYVDDGLVLGSKEDDVQFFLNLLKQEFKITVGSLENYLGMQIKYQSNGSITVSQEIYTNKILERFRMAECNSVSTPASREEGGTDEDVQGKVPYREAVGSLMYLMAATRPDIAFAVSKAARVMEKPTRKDWNDIRRIFKYLRGTTNYGISYQRGSGQLKVFSDADFAGDTKTRRSTTGIVAMLAGGAISWTSQLQKSVALSTTEAEIVAASEGAKELMWLKRLLLELSELTDSQPTLYVDNASAVKLARNPEFHKRSKHIEVRHFYVRERFLNGDIRLEHIEGAKQLADLLTKPLERMRFDYLRKQIGVKCNELKESD